jgi:hypothetical protein
MRQSKHQASCETKENLNGRSEAEAYLVARISYLVAQ